MAERGLGDRDFELTPPADVPRKRVRVHAAGPRAYALKDHQFLFDTCARFLTLRVFLTYSRKRKFKRDYETLLRFSVLYFGLVELGWVQHEVARRLFVDRKTLWKVVRDLEDLREEGDVFDEIGKIVKGYRDGPF